MSRFVEEPRTRYGPPPDPEGSVLYWMERNRDQLPPVRFDCGTEDHLLEDSRTIHQELQRLGIPHEYREHPGAHDWDYWERQVPDAIAFHAKVLRLNPQAE